MKEEEVEEEEGKKTVIYLRVVDAFASTVSETICQSFNFEHFIKRRCDREEKKREEELQQVRLSEITKCFAVHSTADSYPVRTAYELTHISHSMIVIVELFDEQN